MTKKIVFLFSSAFILILLMLSSLELFSNNSNLSFNNSINISSTKGSTFNIAIPSGPFVLDPIDCWDKNSINVIRQVAEPLWYYNWTDYNMGRINMLAESEEFLNTTAVSVTLRQGIQFHDGSTFNADAVKWNFDRILYLTNSTGVMPSDERESSTASLYKDPLGNPLIQGFEITGTYSGILHLTQPSSTILDLLCYVASSMISPTTHTGNARSFIDLTTGDLVGTGPYKYDQYIAEQEVDFSRWDNYWGGPIPIEGNKAYFEKIVFVVIDDPTTRNYAMLAHDVDWLQGPIPDLFDTFRADPTITFTELENAGLSVSYLGFNNRQINVTWRKAMCYAFNYTYMVKDYWQYRVFRSYGWISPGNGEWYTDKQEELGPYYNVTLARMILAGLDPTDHPVPGIPEAIGRDPLNDAHWGLGVNQLIEFNYSYNYNDQWRSDLYDLLSTYFEDISIRVLDGGTDWAYYLYRAYGYVPGGYDDLQIFWLTKNPEYFNPINMLQPVLSNLSNSNSAQVNDAWLENAFFEYFKETDYATKVEMIHNISIYCNTQLYSHMFGFHTKGTFCHSIELYDIPYNLNMYEFYAYPIKKIGELQTSTPGDLTFLRGETGHNITWNLVGENLTNPIYYVYKNGNLNLSDTWQSGDSVTVSLDGLSIGTYNYTIIIQDSPRSVEDYVIVTVVPRLVISHPPDISYVEGSTGNTISWVVSEGYEQNAAYHIYEDNNTQVQTDSWEIKVSIILNVDGLSVGSHTFRIEVYNTLEYIEDNVEVEVREKKPISGFSILILISLALIGITCIAIKLKYKLK